MRFGSTRAGPGAMWRWVPAAALQLKFLQRYDQPAAPSAVCSYAPLRAGVSTRAGSVRF